MIVWLGVGEAEKIFLVALGVTFPIYINTTLGIRQVDPKLIELGRVQGLGTLELIRRIILPGALPSILTGVRYALATAWLALVVAETIGAQSGIGFLAMDAREFLRTDVDRADDRDLCADRRRRRWHRPLSRTTPARLAPELRSRAMTVHVAPALTARHPRPSS